MQQINHSNLQNVQGKLDDLAHNTVTPVAVVGVFCQVRQFTIKKAH
jgi:hypothetical protein